MTPTSIRITAVKQPLVCFQCYFGVRQCCTTGGMCFKRSDSALFQCRSEQRMSMMQLKMLGTGLLLSGTVEWKQRYTRRCMLYVRWSCRGVFKFDCLSSSSGAWRLRFSSSLGRPCTSGECCVFHSKSLACSGFASYICEYVAVTTSLLRITIELADVSLC